MTLRVACLGAGYFARFHHEAWQRLGADLVGVADRDPSRLNDVECATYPDLATLLNAAQVDIIDIITPPPSHAEAIMTALAARPKLIICQKPFATSLEEAQALTAAAHAANTPLIIHENFRFQPWFRAIKSEIDRGTLGEVLNLTFRLRTGDGQGPDAYLARQPYFQTMPRLLIHETGVHYLDTFRYLLGAPNGVYADLRRLNPAIKGEDAGHVILDYDTGTRAVFDGNRLLDHNTDSPRRTFGEALVEGTKATLELSGCGTLTRRIHGAQSCDVILEGRDWPGFAGDCVYALQGHALAALTTGAPLENTAQSYLAVRRMEAAVYQSAETGTRLSL